MTELVPPSDLAPSLPSRIVTVDVITQTEGAPAEGSVTFALLGDIHDAADKKIIKAEKLTMTLVDGKGSIRLPVYDGNTGEWAIAVKKSWAPHEYFIRVPAGGSAIDLSEIQPLMEAPAGAVDLLLTGAGVQVVEGAQWGATVTTTGGVATFKFTVPPGAVAWARPAITSGDLGAVTTPGTYPIGSLDVTGKPVDDFGVLRVEPAGWQGEGMVQEFTTIGANPETYIRRRQSASGAFSTWQLVLTDQMVPRYGFAVGAPVNNISRQGQNLGNFRSASYWSIAQGDGAISNSANTLAGEGVELTLQSGTQAAMQTFPIDYRSPDGKAPTVSFWLYLDTPPAYAVNVYLSPTQGMTSYATARFDIGPSTYAPGWQRVTLAPDKWTTVGVDWTTTFTTLRIRLQNNNAPLPLSVTVAGLQVGQYSKPALMIHFDDALETVYTEAFPIMAAKQLVGTVYVNTASVGNLGRMTLAQLSELSAAGWDIASHGHVHLDYDGATPAAILADIEQARDWLLSNGFSRGALHLATPHGRWNSDVAAAAVSAGLRTLRTTDVAHQQHSDVDLLRMPISSYVLWTTAVASIKSSIDRTMQLGGMGSLLFHEITDVSGSWNYPPALFEEVCDYIWAQAWEDKTVTIARYWRDLNR